MSKEESLRGEHHQLIPESQMAAQLEKEGYTEQFVMTDKGMKDHDGNYVDPDDMTVMKEFRFEGESNPDDMSILYAVKTKDGKKGTITNAYGTYADSRIDEFIMKVERHDEDGKK